MSDSMYRYLERYVGTYRVIADYDLSTHDFPRDYEGNVEESFEDMYIPCRKGDGQIRHTYKQDILAYYTPKQTVAKGIVKELQSNKKAPSYEYDDNYGGEAMIYFNAKDMPFFAKLFGAKTTGKNIPPFSEKNLPGGKLNVIPKVDHKIPKADMKKYEDILSKIPETERDNFAKLVIDEFDSKIELYKGKKFKFREDRHRTRLDNLSYIHYVELWEKFIRYARKRARQEYNISL